jgi:hypothetical protein
MKEKKVLLAVKLYEVLKDYIQFTNMQTQQILEALQNGESLTPIDALNRFGCFRLGARILDLKKLGYDIKTDMVNNGKKRFASYRLKVKDTLF